MKLYCCIKVQLQSFPNPALDGRYVSISIHARFILVEETSSNCWLQCSVDPMTGLKREDIKFPHINSLLLRSYTDYVILAITLLLGLFWSLIICFPQALWIENSIIHDDFFKNVFNILFPLCVAVISIYATLMFFGIQSLFQTSL
jgi:hypothetical protein